jgi:tryptophan synthase alpha chain
VLDEAAEHGTAYIYLVAAYGRSGTVGPPDLTTLVPVMAALRENASVPVAVGFGVKNRSHIDGLGEVGADAAIVGSACVKCVTDSLANGTDVIQDFRALLLELGATPESSEVASRT